jgi:hypothetical protein
MTDVRKHGVQVFRELLPGALPDGEVNLRDGKFGDELLEIGIDNVFGRLWSRDGLSRRDRSLVTRRRDRRSHLPRERLRRLPGRQHRVQDRPRGV